MRAATLLAAADVEASVAVARVRRWRGRSCRRLLGSDKMFCPATGAVPALRAANIFCGQWVFAVVQARLEMYARRDGNNANFPPQLRFRNRLTHRIYISPDPISAGISFILAMLPLYHLSPTRNAHYVQAIGGDHVGVTISHRRICGHTYTPTLTSGRQRSAALGHVDPSARVKLHSKARR